MDDSSPKIVVQVTKYRWIILLLFCLYGAISFIQFLQYTIINNIISKYYNVDEFLVSFTGLIFMISSIMFVAPANFLIRKYDLRTISILSIGFTTVGNLLKLASVSEDRFYIVMISQFICSLGQVFILSIPSKLASTWFGANEVSTACAIAVLGTQSGISIGLLFPSQFVNNSESKDDIGSGLWIMLLTNVGITVAILVLVVIFFRGKPKFPPSLSQIDVDGAKLFSVYQVLKQLMTNRDYLLLLVIFGISNGIYSFFGIVVNNVYLNYFKDSEQEVGIITCITAISGGCIGSVFFGFLLDKWHNFRLTSFVIIASAAGSFILLTWSLEEKVQLATYFTFPIFGFFIASTLVVGFEFATEIAYPLPDEASCSVLNAFIYIFGILFSVSLGNLFDAWGYITIDIIVVVLLSISGGLIYFVTSNLNRHNANINNHK